MKKLISLVLILTMALGCCVFASATEGENTLLIAPNPNASVDTAETPAEAPEVSEDAAEAETEQPTEDAAEEETEQPTEDAAEEETEQPSEDAAEEEEDVTTAGDVIRIILTVIQVLSALALVAAVSFQSGKSSGLGSTMSGSAETFLSKNQTASMEAKLVKVTKIVGIVFILLTLVLNVLQAV